MMTGKWNYLVKKQYQAWIRGATFFLLIASVNSYAGQNVQTQDRGAAAVHVEDKKPLPYQITEADSVLANENDISSRRLFLGSLAITTGLALAAVSPKEVEAKENIVDPWTSMTKKNNAIDLFPTESLSAADASAVDFNSIFQKASKKALSGGKAGASAAVVQVLSLMWLRTSMNYQYRYGGNLVSSLQTLWNEGGIPRLYQGLPFAIVQGPLTRFGDTAANVGILALLESTPETQSLPLPVKTAIGSISAGLWRIVLMPIDSSKTVMQVEGADGLKTLWGLAATEGPSALYQGAVAAAAATAVGHFPWFLTYNFLNEQLPQIAASDDLLLSLARSALLGCSASCVSDICSNSLRVIKTTKQTARFGISDEDAAASDREKDGEISYGEVVRLIIEKDGLAGLFGRGLQTRLLTNSIQGALFSVLWRYFQQ
jgi:hypothetical protein